MAPEANQYLADVAELFAMAAISEETLDDFAAGARRSTHLADALEMSWSGLPRARRAP
jgi:hypothetical protein